MNKDLYKISKTIAHALRHKPENYNIKLDSQGRTDLDALLSTISVKIGTKITKQDILDILSKSDKTRFELSDSKIRAIYGHSTKSNIEHPKIIPLPILYHGTTPHGYEKIKKSGIKKMRRQYVHLSIDIDSAKEVALRRTKTPVILEIKSLEAHNEGHHFYLGGNKIILTNFVPKKYINKIN